MKENNNLLLSIIVPIYNVEKYIHPCLESIYRQGLDENMFEVILVNDGTKDHSMEVIHDIIEQHHNIVVINQENLSLSVARNNGIAIAQGEYILMLDSDDLLIDYSLKPLLEIAHESKTDLVVADYVRMHDNDIKDTNYSISQKELLIKEKTGKELFMEDLNPYECYVWRTLFKRDFLIKNDLKFIPGIYIQDVPFTHECYLKANICIKASWLLNIYRYGHVTAASSTFNTKKAKDYCIAIAKTWELKNLKGLSEKEQQKLNEDVFVTFSKMSCNTAHEIETASDRNKIMDFLKLQVPDLHFSNGIKQRFVSFLFRRFSHTYIFFRFIYAKLIEEILRPFINHRLRRPFMIK